MLLNFIARNVYDQVLIEEVKQAVFKILDSNPQRRLNAYRWINFLPAGLVRKLIEMGCKVGGLGGGDPKHFSLTQWWASSCLELEKEELAHIDRGADECDDSKYKSKWANHLVTPSHSPCALYSLKKKK